MSKTDSEINYTDACILRLNIGITNKCVYLNNLLIADTRSEIPIKGCIMWRVDRKAIIKAISMNRSSNNQSKSGGTSSKDEVQPKEIITEP